MGAARQGQANAVPHGYLRRLPKYLQRLPEQTLLPVKYSAVGLRLAILPAENFSAGTRRPGLGLSVRPRPGRLPCFAFGLTLIVENPFACAGYVQTRTGVAVPMKNGIHPAYVVTTVTCSCGNTFVTRSTKKEIRVDICSACHPFFTGKLKYVDTAGRIEKFQSKFAAGTYNSVQKPAAKAAKKRKPAPTTEEY